MTRAEFVAIFLDLGRRRGDIPIYGSSQWESLDQGDPRRFAAMVRAAECWRGEGEPEAIRARLLEELELNDRFTAWRFRAMSNDLSDAEFWESARYRVSWAELQRRREVAT